MTKTARHARRPRRAAPPPRRAAPLWDLLFGFLRWIGRYVRGFHGAVGTFLAAGFGVSLLLVLAFAELAEEVMQGETRAFDEAVLLWMHEHARPWLTVAALEVTALGSTVVVGMMVFVASVFLWLSRHRYSVLLLWVAMLGTGIINRTLKALFDRPRPDLFPWRTPYAAHESFPSGHAMTAMVAYATLAYLVSRLEPDPLPRRLMLGVAGAVIVLIGLSRLYLGVHYPTDVIAGYITGLVWATCCALGIEAIRYFRHRRPELAREEEDLDAGREEEER